MAEISHAEAGNQTDLALQFTTVAPHYDLLMTGVPYSAWIEYLAKILHNRHCKPRAVLDLACGTGNVSELLAAAGYEVTGVDIASQMIMEAQKKAEQKNLDIRYIIQDAAELDIPGKRFDLCLSLFDSLNYVTDPERLQMVFLKIAAHLSRKGLFIFDMNSEYALMNSFFDHKSVSDRDKIRYDWVSSYNPAERICTVEMDFILTESDAADTHFHETHRQFAYREAEVKEMLEEAGFTDITSYRAYSFRPVTATTDRIFYVCNKQGR